MIKISFPNNFINNKKIDDIYNYLSYKIYKEQEESHISFTYCGIKRKFDSVAIIKEFLMAKDFYNYKFEQMHGFAYDLINLSGQIRISSIVNCKSKSTAVKEFCKKYNKKDFKEYYDYLLEHDRLTISEFQQKSNLPELQDYQKICKIFEYDKLNSTDRHYILSEMDIPVCPYCNMNYTVNYIYKNSVKSTADIDHFFLKSEYPEYSLCLYNFIPACPVCNQKIKGIRQMTRETHVYPHESGFNSKSHFQVTNLLELLIHLQKHAKIELVNQKSDTRVEQSIADLMLNERYDCFSYIAEELIEKTQIYNEYYIDFLSNGIKDLFKSTNVKNLIFGRNLSEEEYGRLSLGKLKQDILNQLKIFDS